jgi:hypothetical protein
MDASIGVTHFTSAAIVVYVINKLKSAKWFPLLQKDWTWINRGASMFVAFAVSIGIHYTWTPSTDGGHQLVLQIPTLSVLALGIWHWLNQYAMQETLHQITKAREPDKNPVAPQGS